MLNEIFLWFSNTVDIIDTKSDEKTDDLLPDTSNKSEKLVVRCHDTSVPHGRWSAKVPSIGNKTPKGTWPKAWGSCGHYDLEHLRLKNKIESFSVSHETKLDKLKNTKN